MNGLGTPLRSSGITGALPPPQGGAGDTSAAQPPPAPSSSASTLLPVTLAAAQAQAMLPFGGADAQVLQQLYLIQAMEKERLAIERERQAIDRERDSIQREREAVEAERRRRRSSSSCSASPAGSPPDGRLEDADSLRPWTGDRERQHERDAIARERRLLAEERLTAEKVRAEQQREAEELHREKEALEQQQREQERYRQQIEAERLNIERELRIMASMTAGETQALKETLERVNAERAEAERERDQLRAELQKRAAAHERLLAERDALSAENERLARGREALLGIQGDEGLRAERERADAELQLARDVIERDKQEIENIRVEIENIMRAWEAERDRQAQERQRLDAEKDEFAALRATLERQRREAILGGGAHEWTLAGLAGMGLLPPPTGGFLAGGSAAAGMAPLVMPTLPSLASMTANAASAAASAEHSLLTGCGDVPAGFTSSSHQINARGESASSLNTSPVSTPPQSSSSSSSSISGSNSGKRKRRRGDSLTQPATPATATSYGQAMTLADNAGAELTEYGFGNGSNHNSSSSNKRRRTVRPWEERFEELLQFREKHRHFAVPASGEYASLRIWVNNQKALHTKGQLAADRYEKLNAIGFPWWTPKGNRAAAKGSKGKNEDDDGALLAAASTGENGVVKCEPTGEQPAAALHLLLLQGEDGLRRRRELEDYFGVSLEAHPAIVDKFAVKHSEHVIDNALVWLGSSRGLQEGLGKNRDSADERVKAESTTEADPDPAAAAERVNKVALLRRIEDIVGLGDEPLRELMDRGGFRVFSSDVSFRREDMDWLTQHYDEIKSAFLLSTFSKKVNKGDWNQKLLMHELEKIYAAFLGVELQHRNLRTKYLSTIGKAVSEWSYYVPRDERFDVWSRAVSLRAAHLAAQGRPPRVPGGPAALSALFERYAALAADAAADSAAMAVDGDGGGDSDDASGPPAAEGRGQLSNLLAHLAAANMGNAAAERANDADPPAAPPTPSSKAASPPSLSSSSSSASLGNSDEGVSSLLSSFNLPNFPSYVHKKPFQRRRGSHTVPGASLAALAYQHMQQHQQQQQQQHHISEVIIEEVGSSDEEDEGAPQEEPVNSSSSVGLTQQPATVEEIEDEEDGGDGGGDLARRSPVENRKMREAETDNSDGADAEPSPGELVIDLNEGDDSKLS